MAEDSSSAGKIISGGLYAAGGFLSGQGSMQQGFSSAASLNEQANNAGINAGTALQNAAINERIARREGKRFRGEVQTAVGASGVQIEGSIVDAMIDGAVELERNAMNIRRQGEQEARNLRSQERAARTEAGDVQRAAAANTVAGGIGTVASVAAIVGGA